MKLLAWIINFYFIFVANAINIKKDDDYIYPKEMFFNQRLDHYDPTDDQMFTQRYFVSDQYWDRKNGPVFFYSGNEGNIETFINNTGFIWDIAPIFKAKVLFAEHRYFGKSLPFGKIKPSKKTKSKYSKLTSEQALADFVIILSKLKQEVEEKRNSSLKIISFGGSYGGMLTAWLRIKYPHIVTGGIASSAPINYFYGQVNCSSYDQVVTQDFLKVPYHGENCVKNIKKSWQLFKQFDEITNGMKKLSNLFHVCSTLKSSSQLIEWIKATFDELAMVNYPQPSTFLMPLPAWPLNETCKQVSNPNLEGFELLKAMFNAVSVFQNYTGKIKCFDINSIDSTIDSSLWDYMTCTEMVQPFCSNGITDMFPLSNWNLSKFSQDCIAKYGTKVRPYWEVINYGGDNLKYASNIMFLNGVLDPWHIGGILTSAVESIESVLMWGAAHHLDLRHVHSDNPNSVKEAQQKEIQLIRKWLKD